MFLQNRITKKLTTNKITFTVLCFCIAIIIFNTMLTDFKNGNTITMYLQLVNILFIILSFKCITQLKQKNSQEIFTEILSFVQRISEGDLTEQNITIKNNDELNKINKGLNLICKNYMSVLKNVVENAENLAIAAQQLSSTSEQLSQGVNEQSVSIEEISSTIEEMTISIEQSKENTYLTQQLSNEALQGVFEISEDSQKTVEANTNIEEKAGIINRIVFQTNILALNAAVEAARIGELGRGFAVVAGEVRNLADNSKKASDEISILTSQGLSIAQISNDRIQTMLPQFEQTSNLLEEIASSSQEHANGVLQIHSAIEQLNTVSQETAASSEELASNAQEIASQVDFLYQSMEFFASNNSNLR